MDYANCIRALLVLVIMSLQASVAHATPEVGWWWNPNESGRGFFIENKDGVIYLAGYFYEDDGRARWLVAGGPIADANSYDGRLLAYSNGQTLFGAYVPPSPPTDVGAVSLRFTDDTHATLTWPGGTIPIEREVFDGGTAPFQPINGWWWNESQSGRGYSVEVRGGSAFVVAFMYDDLGKPVWYFSAGPMATPTTYKGAWLQFANGQTMSGPYHAPSTPIVVGQLEMQFNAEDDLTLTFTDVAAASLDPIPKGVRPKQIVPVKPEFLPPKVPHPDRLDGFFKQTSIIEGVVTAPVGGSLNIKYTTEILADITWIIDNGELSPLGGHVVYTLPQQINGTPVNSQVTLNYTFHTDGAGETCDGKLVNVIVPAALDLGSNLDVGPYGAYAGKIVSAIPLTAQPLTVTCIDPTRIPPAQTDVVSTGPIEVSVPINGKKQVYSIACTEKDFVTVVPPLTYTLKRECSFAGVHP